MTELSEYNYNKGFLWYEKSFTYNGAPLKIVVSSETERDPAELDKRLKFLVGSYLQAPEALAELCSQALLGIKNEAWLNAGEAAYTHSDFKNKIQLARITVNADGSGTFMYNAGNLFRGHAVVAEVHADYTFNYANIEG